MKNSISLFLTTLLLLVLSGCSSDDSDGFGFEGTKGKKVPVSITTENLGETYIEYDNQLRITKLTARTIYPDQKGDEFWDTYVISYDNQNRVSGIICESTNKQYPTSNSKSIYKTSYENNKMYLTCEDQYNGSAWTKVYAYYFDSNNRLSKITYDDNELRDAFEYDEKGNLVKILGGSYNECFEYDDSQGISKNINSPFWLLLLLSEDSHLSFSTTVLNNAIHTKDVDVSSNKNEYVSDIVYTYNKNDFPETFRYTGKGFYKTPYTVKYK